MEEKRSRKDKHWSGRVEAEMMAADEPDASDMETRDNNNESVCIQVLFAFCQQRTKVSMNLSQQDIKLQPVWP